MLCSEVILRWSSFWGAVLYKFLFNWIGYIGFWRGYRFDFLKICFVLYIVFCWGGVCSRSYFYFRFIGKFRIKIIDGLGEKWFFWVIGKDREEKLLLIWYFKIILGRENIVFRRWGKIAFYRIIVRYYWRCGDRNVVFVLEVMYIYI